MLVGLGVGLVVAVLVGLVVGLGVAVLVGLVVGLGVAVLVGLVVGLGVAVLVGLGVGLGVAVLVTPDLAVRVGTSVGVTVDSRVGGAAVVVAVYAILPVSSGWLTSLQAARAVMVRTAKRPNSALSRRFKVQYLAGEVRISPTVLVHRKGQGLAQMD